MYETPFGKTSLACAMACTMLACGSLTTSEEGHPAPEPGGAEPDVPEPDVLVRRPTLAPVGPAPEAPRTWRERLVVPKDEPALLDQSWGSVAVSGDTAVLTRSPWTGNGSAVSAYFFRRGAQSWTLSNTILRAQRPGQQIVAVSISGDRLLMGVGSETSGSAQVIPLDAPDEAAIELPAPSGDGAGFGAAVALAGDTAIVSAPFEDGSRGAVYVFELLAESWRETARLGALDARPGDEFGGSLSLSGDTLVIGAPGPYEDTRWGAAHVFERRAGDWVLAAHLSEPGAGRFGAAVSVQGNAALIAAADVSSLVYVFERDARDWRSAGALRADDGFGEAAAVALAGELAIVGASSDDGGRGTVHVFRRGADGWTWWAALMGGATRSSLGFGHYVSVDAGMALIGVSVAEQGEAALVSLDELPTGTWD